MKFRGEFEHSLDEKGRSAMPAPLREVLAARGGAEKPRLILTRWLDPCLRFYLADEWEALEEAFESGSDDPLDLDETLSDLRRVIFSGTTEVSFDKHSRILIKPSLRRHAGITDAVVWVGQGRYVELWDPSRWNARIEKALEDRDVLRRALRDGRRRG